jgi:hypothetical protein
LPMILGAAQFRFPRKVRPIFPSLNLHNQERLIDVDFHVCQWQDITHKEFDKTWVIKKDNGTIGKLIGYSFTVGEIRGLQTEPEDEQNWIIKNVWFSRRNVIYENRIARSS